MKKILVISNDLDQHGVARVPHTFRADHAETIRAAAGNMAVAVTAPEEAAAHFGEAEVVVAFPARMPDLSQVPNAKWLHSFSAGVDKILTPALISSSISLTNSSGIHATPIAEHILGVCLMFVRGFHKALRAQERHTWSKDESPREIRGATVLVVGLGEIGTETARLMHAFDAHVWVTVRSPKEKPVFVDRLESADMLDTLLPEADFVIITLPHTTETHHLFDAKKFALMSAQGRSASGGKPIGPFLINIGRGGIVNEPDLIEALQEGGIAGAGLDVFEKEPLPAESPLWDMENVIMTPHNSGLSDKYMDRAVELFCRNLRAYLAGEQLTNSVDKKLGY